MTAPLLEATDVTKTFGGFTALNTVSITVAPGERLGLNVGVRGRKPGDHDVKAVLLQSSHSSPRLPMLSFTRTAGYSSRKACMSLGAK